MNHESLNDVTITDSDAKYQSKGLINMTIKSFT